MIPVLLGAIIYVQDRQRLFAWYFKLNDAPLWMLWMLWMHQKTFCLRLFDASGNGGGVGWEGIRVAE